MYQWLEYFEARWLVLFCASEFQFKFVFFFRVHYEYIVTDCQELP